MEASNISQEVRLDVANDLLNFLEILKTKTAIDIESIGESIDKLKEFNNIPKTEYQESRDNNYWGYATEIRIELDNLEKHLHQNLVTTPILTFNIDLVADANYYFDNDDKDPLKDLKFNIFITAWNTNGKEIVHSLHLDRHPENSHSSEPHPKYHFQFGGKELHSRVEDYGQTLFLDSPRLMHYPMDFILGLDFVLSNYVCETWNKLQGEHEYISLIAKYQKLLLNPYFNSLFNHWQCRTPFKNRPWNTQDIMPQIVCLPEKEKKRKTKK